MFLNVVGGVKIVDPAADLAVVLAIASALLDKPVPSDMVVLGEVGLSSEVRSVAQLPVRVAEADKLGFRTIVVPKNNMHHKMPLATKNIDIVAVETIQEALKALD